MAKRNDSRCPVCEHLGGKPLRRRNLERRTSAKKSVKISHSASLRAVLIRNIRIRSFAQISHDMESAGASPCHISEGAFGYKVYTAGNRSKLSWTTPDGVYTYTRISTAR